MGRCYSTASVFPWRVALCIDWVSCRHRTLSILCSFVSPSFGECRWCNCSSTSLYPVRLQTHTLSPCFPADDAETITARVDQTSWEAVTGCNPAPRARGFLESPAVHFPYQVWRSWPLSGCLQSNESVFADRRENGPQHQSYTGQVKLTQIVPGELGMGHVVDVYDPLVRVLRGF